jgi:hypothetical protein
MPLQPSLSGFPYTLSFRVSLATPLDAHQRIFLPGLAGRPPSSTPHVRFCPRHRSRSRPTRRPEEHLRTFSGRWEHLHAAEPPSTSPCRPLTPRPPLWRVRQLRAVPSLCMSPCTPWPWLPSFSVPYLSVSIFLDISGDPDVIPVLHAQLAERPSSSSFSSRSVPASSLPAS